MNKDQVMRMILSGWKEKTVKSLFDKKHHQEIRNLFIELKDKVEYSGVNCMNYRNRTGRRSGISWSESK